MTLETLAELTGRPVVELRRLLQALRLTAESPGVLMCAIVYDRLSRLLSEDESMSVVLAFQETLVHLGALYPNLPKYQRDKETAVLQVLDGRFVVITDRRNKISKDLFDLTKVLPAVEIPKPAEVLVLVLPELFLRAELSLAKLLSLRASVEEKTPASASVSSAS